MTENNSKLHGDQLLLRDVELGLDAEQLLKKTALGQALLKKAEEDEKAALDALLLCDPNDAKEVARLQQIAFVPAKAIMWLEQIIVSGKNSERILNETGD